MTPSEIKGLQHGNSPVVLRPFKNFSDFFREVVDWQRKTFGHKSGQVPIGTLKHILKEVQEVMVEDDSRKREMEAVDLLFLVIQLFDRLGMSLSDVLTLGWQKLDINKSRTWPPVVDGEPTEHLKGGGE